MITADTEIHTNDIFLRKAIYIVHKGRCFYSGRDVSLDDMHIDHIQPRKLGGGNNINNYVLCCQELNLSKSASFSVDFLDVVTAFNKLVYVDKVVELYNELKFNNLHFKDYIEINEYCKKHKIIHKGRFIQRAKNKLKVIRQPVLNQTRNRMYFKADDLDVIKKYYIDKYGDA